MVRECLTDDLLTTLDPFTTAYIECALWSSTDDYDQPLDAVHDREDIARSALTQMIAECKDFQEGEWGGLILEDPERAGHDFWLTRNGHGAGFWDGDWDEPLPESANTTGSYETVGDYLTAMTRPYGSCDLYVGDDGLIYLI